MKKNFLLYLYTLLAFQTVAQNSATFPCYKQTSTSPGAPYNADYYDGLIEEVYMNHFSWFAEQNLNLLPYPLVDMTPYGNTTAMLNVLNSNIQNYNQLTDVWVEDFDYYPEDGWELLSLNLGFYPDGTALSDHLPLEQSAFQDVPYIIFYNKQRSIIRLFANTTTGLTSAFNPDVAKVTLMFRNPLFVSGLLRPAGEYDVALDKPTSITEVVTMAKTPGQSNHWFMAQFQVGYDPCTCFFRSDLEVNFQFIDNSTIHMNSNGVSTEMNMSDILSGEYDVDEDFLANVDYTNGQAQSGTVIYNTMIQLYDNYIERLEYVKAQNALINEQNQKIEDALQVLKLAKNALINPIAGWISDPNVVFILVRLGLFSEKLGTDEEVSVKPDYDKIEKKSKEYLAGGFDALTKQIKSGIQEELKAPPMPTGTVWQASFAGEIGDFSPVFGPSFFNPGTYPLASLDNVIEPENDQNMSGLSLNAHNYPVYNEVLGLFALLETPKFNVFTKKTNVDSNSMTEICPEVACSGSINETYDIARKVTHNVNENYIVQVQLAEPLKYVFNPAAEIDMTRTTVKAAIVVRGTRNNEDNRSNEVIDNTNSDHHAKEIVYHNTQKNIDLFNLTQIEGILATTDMAAGVIADVSYSTPYVSPDVLNEVVAKLQYFEKKVFFEYPPVPYNNAGTSFCPTSAEITGWNDKVIFDADYGFTQAFSYQSIDFDSDPVISSRWTSFLSSHSIELKILVDYYFLNSGHNNTDNNTTQVFTYQINADEYNLVSQIYDIPFDLVHHPSSEYHTVDMTLGLIDTHFDYSLLQVYPYSVASGYDVRAIETITINGNLSIDEDYFPNPHVDIVAGSEIIVTGESVINADMTLKLDQYWTSTPTPEMTNEDVTNFCKGTSPIPYQANTPATINGQSGTSESLRSQKDSAQDKSIQLSLYPNPSQEIITIQVPEFTISSLLQIRNSIGELIEEISIPLNHPQLFQYNLKHLPCGSFLLTFINDETIITKPFLIVR